MTTLSYTEQETGFNYSLVLTDREVYDISIANPHEAQQIFLRETGVTIVFDNNGKASITLKNGKHSFANSSDVVHNANIAMHD